MSRRPANRIVTLDRLWRRYEANDREIAKLEARNKALLARIREIENDQSRPLSTRECADCLGVTTQFIRQAIRDGHLKAETFTPPSGRTSYRIHEDDFVRFLLLVKWSRIPARLASIAEQLGAVETSSDRR